jgi:regulator of replication initiation timing
MEALQRELGRLEGRLELTAVAESTLRESVERERERAEALQLKVERLREQLAEASTPQRPSENAPVWSLWKTAVPGGAISLVSGKAHKLRVRC